MPQRQLRRPGRLAGVSYIGIQRYSLTLCTADRRRWFVDRVTVDLARSHLLREAAKHRFAIPAHCAMPDHLHIYAEGLSAESEMTRFIDAFKQQTGFHFSAARGARLWQKGYYDHLVRSEEAAMSVIRYILENPVRAGLVKRFSDYPFSGSDRFSLDELAEAWAIADDGRGGSHR